MIPALSAPAMVCNCVILYKSDKRQHHFLTFAEISVKKRRLIISGGHVILKRGDTMRKIGMILCVMLTLTILCSPVLGYGGDEVLGQAESVLTAVSEPNAKCTETSLGDLASDAIRETTGADLAVVPGGVFAANMDAGAITWQELVSIFPAEDTIRFTRVTPAELYAILERSVGQITLSQDEYVDERASEYAGFLQISGFRFRFDVSSSAGQRISEITLSDGRKLDRDMEEPLMTLAFPGSISEEYIDLLPPEQMDAEKTMAEAVAEYVQRKGTVSAPESGRIEAFGSNDNAIIRRFPLPALLIGVLLFAFAGLSRSRGRSLPRGMGE